MIQYFYNFFLLLLISFIITVNTIADSAIEHKIAVLVNEKVITSYDVVQRLKLTAIINRINIDSINNQLMLNNVVDELIQEMLNLRKSMNMRLK